jgi:hypothetical protein
MSAPLRLPSSRTQAGERLKPGQGARAIGLWNAGEDTSSIARLLGATEAAVYNSLAALRRRRRPR